MGTIEDETVVYKGSPTPKGCEEEYPIPNAEHPTPKGKAEERRRISNTQHGTSNVEGKGRELGTRNGFAFSPKT